MAPNKTITIGRKDTTTTVVDKVTIENKIAKIRDQMAETEEQEPKDFDKQLRALEIELHTAEQELGKLQTVPTIKPIKNKINTIDTSLKESNKYDIGTRIWNNGKFDKKNLGMYEVKETPNKDNDYLYKLVREGDNKVVYYYEDEIDDSIGVSTQIAKAPAKAISTAPKNKVVEKELEKATKGRNIWFHDKTNGGNYFIEETPETSKDGKYVLKKEKGGAVWRVEVNKLAELIRKEAAQIALREGEYQFKKTITPAVAINSVMPDNKITSPEAVQRAEIEKKRQTELNTFNKGDSINRYDSNGKFQDVVIVEENRKDQIRFKQPDGTFVNKNKKHLNADAKSNTHPSYRVQNFDVINAKYDAELKTITTKTPDTEKNIEEETFDEIAELL